VPARTYLIFGDIEGKLDVLRVQCTKCARKNAVTVAPKRSSAVTHSDEAEKAAARPNAFTRSP
jgi:hypothetical protein